MKPWLHAHPGVLITAIIVLAVVAVVIVVLITRLSRPHTGHHQAPPRRDPVWDDELPAHDEAWDHIADELGDEYAWHPGDVICDDPDCSTMTHTGNMPKLDPLPQEGFPEPLRPMQTVSLPPWEFEEIKARWVAAVERHDEIVVLEDLPGPEAAAVRPDDQGSRAGKPRNTWTGLLGRPDPVILPAVATPSPAAQPEMSAGLSDGGEPVIEGIVVGAPAPDDFTPATVEILAGIDAWAKAQHDVLYAWSSQGRELEMAS